MRMMRFGSIVVLCLVVFCSAQQDKCCMKEDTFALSTGMLIGWHADQSVGVLSESVFSVLDYTQSRFLYNTTVFSDGNLTMLVMIIDDYKQNIEWSIDFVTKKCQKTSVPEERQKPTRCVPDNAKFIQQVNNPGDVLVNSWYFDYKSKTETGGASLTVTAKDCIPTGITFVGKATSSGEEVDVMTAGGYYNYEPLNDVSKYFKLPSFCDSNEVIDTKVAKAARDLVNNRRFL